MSTQSKEGKGVSDSGGLQVGLGGASTVIRRA